MLLKSETESQALSDLSLPTIGPAPFKVGVVMGEVSGDNLAAPLMRALKTHYPTLEFAGVLGPKSIQEKGKALFPMQSLSVMGIIEPLLHLPEIYRIRKSLIQHFTAFPPNFFLGVDAPDFNLGLENILKSRGIPTVHYVSPSVWAWRSYRIKKIKKSVDLMICLFPFEEKFYHDHDVPVCYIGHPLAEEIPIEIDTNMAKQQLGLDIKRPLLTILPGSRNNELKKLAKIFIQTAALCFKQRPDLQFVVPVVSEVHKEFFTTLHQALAPKVPIQILVNAAHIAMAASDAVLVTSGTATLEVMLHKKPMAVAYRMNALGYQIAKRLVKLKHISLPNLLANETLVPEFIQDEASPENLSKALLEFLSPSYNRKPLEEKFLKLHENLRQGGSKKAAEAIVSLLQNNL